ncbi:unnamed protein product [Medioppia subpectinata]|uniref:Phosphatidylethanolamine-binding protein n=1 Tax=Medioppia subpectinata TaxID=1979941 RepID=A0A7R9KYE4_9ACAR|nr:unnamed protein product [Medioppia subpectinata]CAG2111928.1 unnamed protein product [Medioppia subpectinata]
MEKHGVIPDVIDSAPAHVLHVRYPSGAEPQLGNELTPHEVKDLPSVMTWPTVANTLYAVCMLDPDSTSRRSPKYRHWQHWLVVNVPNNNTAMGEILSDYVGPGPSMGTGLHRVNNSSVVGRLLFKLDEFAKKYNLGAPLAASLWETMEKHGVIPDVIDSAPTHVLHVRYPSGAEPQLGNELTPHEVKDLPSVMTWPTVANTLYAVCMLDPDSPSRRAPKYRHWQHWLVVNVPNNHTAMGEILSDYVGPGPSMGTGLHRVNNSSVVGRLLFKVDEFAKKYNLGTPLAGNFFHARWDDYVPKLHLQLSGA